MDDPWVETFCELSTHSETIGVIVHAWVDQTKIVATHFLDKKEYTPISHIMMDNVGNMAQGWIVRGFAILGNNPQVVQVFMDSLGIILT